ncbi:MAG TPA: tyrosine--tRNA ligase [Bacillota bacterium]|jgi:tyrosyl-tRNA synthetase|nr:tyrosine--tRNA ligase [Fastidiosipila sp.]HPX93822.1 tyrosine--tRNA ligase [Bacillota bacterium]HQB81647.1 tyrosine--tRNA ligase [Bacillota bacterium]
MGKNVFDTLLERGYIAQVTHEEAVRRYLSQEGATFYVGFDPTADSLHAGHLVQIMIMSHMQQAGIRPIALMGGGTGYVGDPSGRQDMRSVMTPEVIAHNVGCFVKQMSHFLDFSSGRVILDDNANWLVPLNYIEFIREVGPHFTVNRMLSADCYKQRMDSGLTFLEFNYMILQAYDFLMLFRKYGCRLQAGGDDQWSNIIAGTELIRKKEQEPAYGMTFKLLETPDGQKMGKTAKGAVWLDENKYSVYDFYQHWRNVDDANVTKFMRFLTFLDMDEIRRYEKLEGADINQAKIRLAYEVTAVVHGHEKAKQAEEAARSLFGGGGDDTSVPTETVNRDQLNRPLIDVLASLQLTRSKGEARRLIEQGGLYVNDGQVKELYAELTEDLFSDGELLLRMGKKRHIKLVLID